MNQKNFNNCKSNFELTDVYALASIIGHGCSQKTKDRLISTLIYETAKIPSYGILERLMFENFEWRYTAGQSYVDEIKTIRNIILRGK
jgi:hypothetical protein